MEVVTQVKGIIAMPLKLTLALGWSLMRYTGHMIGIDIPDSSNAEKHPPAWVIINGKSGDKEVLNHKE